MTSSITWPATLPGFRFEPYSVAPRSGAIESTNQAITDRARLYTLTNEVVGVEMVLTATQCQALQTFYKTTTAMGTQAFLVRALVSGLYQVIEAQFFGAPPAFTPVSPNYVRAAFDMLTWPDQVDPPPPVLDYDEIVLARSPDGYWPMRDLSPTNPIVDISGNGLNLNFSGSGLLYQQGDLLTDPGSSLGNNGGINFDLGVALGTTDTGPDPVTIAGWWYFDSALLAGHDAFLFDIGGSSGGAQITKAKFWRDGATGKLKVFWNANNSPNPATDHSATFSGTTIPLDTPVWLDMGQNDATLEWFVNLDGATPDTASYAGQVPWQIPGRQTFLRIGAQAFGSGATGQLLGKYARVEYYTRALPTIDMHADWHL